ncbi:MAG TPA: MFS transporter, partial [Vicingus sp.]|nr:MFS transporter [Vicingus sp.]
NGFGGSVKNTAMAELFGTKMLGSVRSLFTTLTVFSTALGPLFFGILLDAGYPFELISVMALILFVLATINSLRILKY